MIAEFLATLGIVPFLRQEKEKVKPLVSLSIGQNKYNYRPQYLQDYIGQDKAKDLVRLNLNKIINIKPVHILISGTKGHGKTTLANVIANHLSFPISYYIGGTFGFEELKQFLYQNEELERLSILFIDEIHNLDKKVAEFLYPILEDFVLPTNGASIRPFIFIGATTEKYRLIKKFAPLVDRCGCQIILESYKAEDIEKILKQYNHQIYKEAVPDEIFKILSNNSRFTPRIALALFDDYICCKDINKTLEAHRIIKDSLTDIDIKILTHLAELNKPIGEEALSIIGGIEKQDYKTIIEPFLLSNGYISRTNRGRVICSKGIEILNSEDKP